MVPAIATERYRFNGVLEINAFRCLFRCSLVAYTFDALELDANRVVRWVLFFRFIQLWLELEP